MLVVAHNRISITERVKGGFLDGKFSVMIQRGKFYGELKGWNEEGNFAFIIWFLLLLENLKSSEKIWEFLILNNLEQSKNFESF